MELFNQLDFGPEKYGVQRSRIYFPNGYGASVITGPSCYSSQDKPYELAVLHNCSLCYTTPITDDVIGHLTAEEVDELLTRIAALPPKE